MQCCQDNHISAMPPIRNNIHSTTATKAITNKTMHSQIPVMKGKEDLKKIKEVHVEKMLQLITKRNSSDAFVLINRHKHIYSIDKDNEPPQMVCTQHITILALNEGVTYSGRLFLLFGFPSRLVLWAPWLCVLWGGKGMAKEEMGI